MAGSAFLLVLGLILIWFVATGRARLLADAIRGKEAKP